MEAQGIDLWTIIWQSGWVVKGVLFSLIFASVVTWAIVIKKKRFLNAYAVANNEFLQRYNRSASLREFYETIPSLAESPLRQTFVSAYEEYSKISVGYNGNKNKIAAHFARFGMGALERALKQAANEVEDRLGLFLPVVASIGSVAPFVGLFGTVWGIIDSFTGLAAGGATLEAVAPGIAEALVATAVGLVVAIPAVWFFNKFSQINNSLINEIDSFGQDFLNNVERSLIDEDDSDYRPTV